MGLKILDHPLVEHKLSLARQSATGTSAFRQLVREIGLFLVAEATKDLPLEEMPIETWSGKLTAKRIKGKKLVFVPVMRAGCIFLDAALELVPVARIAYMGVFREEDDLQPHVYLERIPDDIADRLAIILDPIVATGGTLASTIERLEVAGCRQIHSVHLLCTPEGATRITEAYPNVEMYAASLEQYLTKEKITFPGLGDAGDRIAGIKRVTKRRELAARRLREVCKEND